MDARLPPEMSPGGGSHRVGSSLRDVLSTAIRESGPVGDGSKTRGSCFVKPLNKTLLTYPEAETHTVFSDLESYPAWGGSVLDPSGDQPLLTYQGI